MLDHKSGLNGHSGVSLTTFYTFLEVMETHLMLYAPRGLRELRCQKDEMRRDAELLNEERKI